TNDERCFFFDANPAANYTWFMENYKLLQSLEGSYYLTSISSEDGGNYSCKAQNQHGQTSSSVFIDVQIVLYLTVEDIKPSLAPLPSVSVSPSAEIVEGSSVTLTCSSDANPAANYTWYKDKQKLIQSPEGSHYLTSISSEDGGNYSCKAQNQHGQTSSSVFIDVQAEHRGNYYCEAQNRRGRNKTTVHLTVAGELSSFTCTHTCLLHQSRLTC
uniref:Ig-like domain-containing protein n=1 Tax=Sparus aurata TaxID=8175 RepID=A0A671TG07_SPAAU